MDLIFTELLKVLPFGQAIGLALLLILLKIVQDLKTQLQLMNGSVRELKQWATSHERSNDQRHVSIEANLNREHADMQSQLEEIRERCATHRR